MENDTESNNLTEKLLLLVESTEEEEEDLTLSITSSSAAPSQEPHLHTCDGISNTFFALLGFQDNPLSESPDLRLSMLSNFATSYNVVNVGVVLDLMEHSLLLDEKSSSLSVSKLSALLEHVSVSEGKSLCSPALIAGMIVGQVFGGSLGDMLGRHSAMSAVMCLQVVSAIGSAFAYPIGNLSIYEVLAIWRFFLGIGCGGVYPLAAILTAESTATKEERAKLVALTFSMQGVGYLAAPFFGWCLITLFGEENYWAWRIILGCGCLPGLILGLIRIWRRLFFKCKYDVIQNRDSIQLDTNLTTDGERTIEDERETVQTEEESNPPTHLWHAIQNEEKLLNKLLGTAGCWFLFDVLFYGNTLFQRVVLEQAFGKSETVTDIAFDQVLIALIALPGYFVSIAVIGCKAPKYVQVQGFLVMTLLYTIMGFYFDQLKVYRWLLLSVYGGTFLFSNFGPNTTTFLLPSMTFSPSCRSTLNGLCAACGKAGALIGASFFGPISDDVGDPIVMLFCASLSLVGVLMSVCFVQDIVNDEIETLFIAADVKDGNCIHTFNGEQNKSQVGEEFTRRKHYSAVCLLDFED